MIHCKKAEQFETLKEGIAMIQYSLPDITWHLSFNLKLSQLRHTAPELFYDDAGISSVYGCFPGCIMNGGRYFIGKRYTYDQIAKAFDSITEESLITRLTFTNMLITPEQFEDEYCNMILRAAQGRNVEIIVYLDELDDYISSRYHFKRTLSTTRALSGVDELNAMLARYDMVVLDYNRNKDDDFLRKVSDPTRLEVMPNETCQPDCPLRQQHYIHNSRCQLDNMELPFSCAKGHQINRFTSPPADSQTLLSIDDIRRLYNTYGISNYKIVGRSLSVEDSLNSYMYYLIRPEYRPAVQRILKDVIRKPD